MTIIGFDAAAKAQRTGEAIFTRTSELLKENGLEPYTETNIELIGAESCYGPHARASQAREVVLRLSATHVRKEALQLLAREVAPAGTSWAPGTTGFGGGRASASPSIRQYAFLLDKSHVRPVMHLGGQATDIAVPPGSGDALRAVVARSAPSAAQADPADAADCVEVPLIRMAFARSGDKGDISNIGIIARHPEWLPVLRAQLTEVAVAGWLAHLVKGKVTRHEVPGIGAFNFVCESALGGGGMATLRNDSLGKGMAQIVLGMPVRIPVRLLLNH